MVTAQATDKERIIEILTLSFEQNLSVGYICGQGARKMQRIRHLMEYAYKVCAAFGKVVISEDRNACALVLFPDQKRLTWALLRWDIGLIFQVIGVLNIAKVLKREKQIKSRHPSVPFYYLWFMGVHPVHKGLGFGTELLNFLMADAKAMDRPFYLETSTLKNLPWYKKFGFMVYDELYLGYTLYFLKQ